MSWSNIKLADVQVETTKFPPLPAGDFTFTIVPGTATNRNKTYNVNGTTTEIEELSVRVAIADGDRRGAQVFLSYPDPEATNPYSGKSFAWSAQALKKLEIAIGIDSLPGEDPADYLNRVANQNATFGMTLQPGKYVPTGATEALVEPSLFSVHPAVVTATA